MAWSWDDVTLANISIEMNRDLTVLQRDGYTFLDLISDIGGIQSILLQIFASIVVILNHNYLPNYLVSKLFVRRVGDVAPFRSSELETTVKLKERRCQSLSEYLNETCKCRCLA